MKNKPTIIIILVLFAIAVLLGINYFYQPFYQKIENIGEEIKTDESNLISSLDSENNLLKDLSIEEKISQLIALPIVIDDDFFDASGSAQLGWLRTHKSGFVLLFGKNISKERAVSAILNIRNEYQGFSLQPIILVDHEGGSVQRLSGEGFTKLPSWQESCESLATESANLFRQSAKEISDVGINVVLAPVLDSAKDNKVLKTRLCSDEKQLINTAENFIVSFAEYGVMSAVKHFPGIGSTTKDLHKYYEEIQVQSKDTEVFSQILSMFPNIGVVTAHVGVENMFDGTVCSLSKACLSGFADNYPNTFLFTDALDMQSALHQKNGETKSLIDVSKEAIYAGNNVLLFGDLVNSEEVAKIISALSEEYKNSSEFKSQVDSNLEKIIKLKQYSQIK